MTEIIVPQPKEDKDGNLEIFPTLGPQVCDFLEERFVYGPGPLRGQPYVVRDDFRYILYRAYEHFPDGYVEDYDGEKVDYSGRRHFNKVTVSLPKGSAKTELMALVACLELHPDAPIRFNGYDPDAPGGMAPGRSVVSPFIPLLAPTKDQLDDLAYGASMVITQDIEDADLFDVTRERIQVQGEAESRILPVAASAGRLDGLKPTFQCLDEPLALDTPIPTSKGWSTMGEIEGGDYVFDRWGNPVLVTGKSPVHTDRECYKVTFRNGESVITDANHRWKAINWANRPKGEVVVSTKQMLEAGLDTGYGPRWRLPRGNGWGGTVQDPDIDPYLLGLWLGDGSTDAGYIHTHEDDMEHFSRGYEFNTSTGKRRCVRWLVKGWRATLRKHGFLGNKRIPEWYSLTSESFRRELLAGLIDSDGYVNKSAVTFVQGKEGLSRDVCLIANSLGIKTSLHSRDDIRSRTGKMWKVQFAPKISIPTRAPRKVIAGKAKHMEEWPTIVSIEKVDSVPVQCLEVDNDDHLFVFGKSGYLTHNTHRMFDDRHHKAVQTMENNLTKRMVDDPWQLVTTTAGDPNEPSVAKAAYDYGMKIFKGKAKDPRTFFYHRQTSDENAKFDTMGNRIRALKEASGEEASKFRDLVSVAAKWDEGGVDTAYLERVWCNRWVQSSQTAFNAHKFEALGHPSLVIEPGSLVTLGFDGAQTDDSTGLVMTDVKTGVQNLVGLWERPEGVKKWRVPVSEVNSTVEMIFEDFEVLMFYADPPYWQEAISTWEGRWEKRVIEWPTRNTNNMYYAIRSYNEAIEQGELSHDGNPDLVRHVANAGRNNLNVTDDEGLYKYRLAKITKDRKFDACMAAILSWQAMLDAKAKGLTIVEEKQAPRRIR